MGAESDSGAVDPALPGKKPPTGFADVARRMTSRTTDLIAIAIVAVASLTFGRQIVEWWHAPPPASPAAGESPAPRPAWEEQLQPVALEFGDLPFSMTRQAVAGDRKAAVAALVRHCEAGASAARAPWRDWDEAERQLIARTEGLTPVAEETGVWRVYVIDERFPMTAGVRRFATGQTGAARGASRLVCWGMAMPGGENTWHLYIFQAAGAGRAVPSGLPEVPLPPNARRNLSLRDERGAMLVGFAGKGSPAEWMKFYDDWFAGKGWSSDDGWLTGGGASSARYRKRGAPEAGRIEIQFAAGPDRELIGLLQIVPNASDE